MKSETGNRNPETLMIRQFRYSSDNLGYLIFSGNSAAAIDGGAVESIIDFIDSHVLKLSWISNTHEHPDHTAGNRLLMRKTGAALLRFSDLQDRRSLTLDGMAVTVYRTPGHTLDSVCFHAGCNLITGDTLFNGTVGNCFTGDLDAFYRSIRLLASFPPETRIYAGHDYVRFSMEFARRLEPQNRAIDEFLKKYDPAHVFSTLEDEFRMNPYLRFNGPGIIRLLESKGLPRGTEEERWKSLMSID